MQETTKVWKQTLAPVGLRDLAVETNYNSNIPVAGQALGICTLINVW